MSYTVPWTFSQIVDVPDDNTDITFTLDSFNIPVGGTVTGVITTMAVKLTGAADSATDADSVESRPSSNLHARQIGDAR